jgi:hypothetical protein
MYDLFLYILHIVICYILDTYNYAMCGVGEWGEGVGVLLFVFYIVILYCIFDRRNVKRSKTEQANLAGSQRNIVGQEVETEQVVNKYAIRYVYHKQKTRRWQCK